MQRVYFDRLEMKYQEFTLQNMGAACEKQMAFVSCLAPYVHELLEPLMFFLSSNPDSLHQLC